MNSACILPANDKCFIIINLVHACLLYVSFLEYIGYVININNAYMKGEHDISKDRPQCCDLLGPINI